MPEASKRCIVFFAHPNFEKSRLNKSLIQEVSKYPEIKVKNLYESYGKLTFDSHINPKEDQKLIENNDKIIIQFPFQWYSTPPLLKQWIDDVFSSGWAYAIDNPKTAGKQLLVAITTLGQSKDYAPSGYNNYYVSEFLNQFIQTAKLCKMTFSGAFFVHGARVITEAELVTKAKEYIAFIKS